MNNPATAVLLRVVEKLDDLNIPYVVGGSFASSLHGMARATNDVDFVVAISLKQVKAFVASFENEFYLDEQAIIKAIQLKKSFNMIHLESIFKVDMFIAKFGGFQEQELKRRQLQQVSQHAEDRAYIASPEDTILAKLDWYRKGNFTSDKQWQDIASIIKIQGDKLDIDYLKQWSKELGLSGLLDKALSESFGE
ncbi:MAG: DUF6036 family nucleotidyltransferase [Acidobacteriota bacterium]